MVQKCAVSSAVDATPRCNMAFHSMDNALDPVAIKGIGTALPPHCIPQADARAAAQKMFGSRFEGFERLAGVFASAGIERRYSVLPIERFFAPFDWSQRNEAYLAGAGALFIAATRAALADASLHADEIDIVITISSTGIATPSLEAMVGEALGLRSDIMRVPVFGLGCAGGVLGIGLAMQLARAAPGRRVLLVAVETCTLAFRTDRLTKENIVATALFGDGAAALVLQAGPSDRAFIRAASHQWPDTLAIMGWRVDTQGFGVIFDRAIPPFIEAEIATVLMPLLDRETTRPDRFICHPGGAKVIHALETALQQPQGSLVDERAVLRDCGNMSAPTVLFVLQRALAQKAIGAYALLALGPGFSLGYASMRRE